MAAAVGVVLVINIVVLFAVVMPLRRRCNRQRAGGRGAALRGRDADFKHAEATRDGQGQATKDLERFYNEVLPANFAAARRLTHLKLAQMVR